MNNPPLASGAVVVIRDNNLVDARKADKWKPHHRASVRVEDEGLSTAVRPNSGVFDSYGSVRDSQKALQS